MVNKMTKDECHGCSYLSVDEVDWEYWTCDLADNEDIETIDFCPLDS